MDLGEKIGDIPEWGKYEPEIQHYSTFSTNITAAAAKITDVHRTFCTGRASFIYYDCDEFGQLVQHQDELSKRYFRSILMYNALSSYNICIDLSWQVVWLYLSNFDLDLIYNKKLYERYLNECNLVTLNYQLTLAKEFKIRDFMNTMFNDSLTQQIRKKYNFFKHKGALHVPGLGENHSNLPFGFNNISLKQYTREEFDLTEWSELLIKFHWFFHSYFQEVIRFVIPRDYVNLPMDFISDTINYGILVENYFNEKEVTSRG